MIIVKGKYASLHRINGKVYLNIQYEGKRCTLEIIGDFDKEYIEKKIVTNCDIDLYLFKRLKLVDKKTKELINKELLTN